ncbi:MAG: DUF805 domain-containing protein [Hyphomonadaceae bacterium]|nr:DUF805 domain-containing protein [Hyphomonadaceae bacterium]
MAEVFISYAREDKARADQVARALQALGLDCFWDTEIPPGQTWADYIEGKLGACKAVVVLWSANSIGSQWVREEARMGRESGKLIPAMLDGSPAPFGFGEVQAADLSAWNGDYAQPSWTRFSNAVYRAARGADAPAPKPQRAAMFAQPTPTFSGADAQSTQTLSPLGYISRCFRMYFDGGGRARRSEFGWFMLFSIGVMLVTMLLDVGLFGTDPYTNSANSIVITALTWLALLAPSVAVSSRRAHDVGWSGWLAALVVIPYLGLLVVLLLVFIPGQPGANQHGPNPKGE